MGTMTVMVPEKRNFSKPDETRTFDKGVVEQIALGGITLTRMTLQPGWKWSTSIKPNAKTESCQFQHLQYVVSGRIHLRMDDGLESEFGPGDIMMIPPGHDGWVVGNEPFVGIEVGSGMGNYGKK